jgi:hypothetical protein
MPDLTPEDNAASMQLIAEAIRQTADLQRQGIERLETKATLVLGFVATAVPIYAAQHHTNSGIRIAAFVAYGVAAISGLFASRPYRSKESPPPREFASAFIAHPQPPASVSRWLIMSRVKTYRANKSTADQKAGLTWIALLAFVAAAALSVSSLLL